MKTANGKGELDISVWWPHHVGSDTQDVFDDFFGPAQFGYDLLVGQCSERRVTPGVDRNLMATHVLGLESPGERNNSGANHEKCGFDIVLVKIVEKIGGIVSGAIVVSEAPVQGSWAVRNVRGTCTTATGPPAATGIGCSSGVVGAPA